MADFSGCENCIFIGTEGVLVYLGSREYSCLPHGAVPYVHPLFAVVYKACLDAKNLVKWTL
jgi:hypothetical protein